jgi:hypothetical protein
MAAFKLKLGFQTYLSDKVKKQPELIRITSFYGRENYLVTVDSAS